MTLYLILKYVFPMNENILLYNLNMVIFIKMFYI